jgi:hypothetical protein
MKWQECKIMDPTIYDANYYLHGKDSGKSLYENYTWMPELTVPMVHRIIEHCGIEKTDIVLDFGCARGYTVKAFREAFGIEAYGVDVSEWAIENADEKVKEYCWQLSQLESGPKMSGCDIDWIIAKDVLEHVPQVADTITNLMEAAKTGVFAVVPLSPFDNTPYVVPDYEKDVTHIHRLTLASWVRMFLRPGWEVTASYRVHGVKDNYAQWENGNGFITSRRI